MPHSKISTNSSQEEARLVSRYVTPSLRIRDESSSTRLGDKNGHVIQYAFLEDIFHIILEDLPSRSYCWTDFITNMFLLEIFPSVASILWSFSWTTFGI